MSKFKIVRKISLDFLGEEYKDSYLKFNAISMAELEGLQSQFAGIDTDSKDSTEIVKLLANQLGSRFVEGKVASEGKLVDVEKDDLLDLPVDAVNRIVEVLAGKVDPN